MKIRRMAIAALLTLSGFVARAVGYYTFLAMQLNAAQYPIPADGRKPPWMPRYLSLGPGRDF
jgi:hypothetical protein